MMPNMVQLEIDLEIQVTLFVLDSVVHAWGWQLEWVSQVLSFHSSDTMAALQEMITFVF